MIINTPPHNADAERAIIGAALAFGKVALAQSSALVVDDFYLPGHRHAWQAINATDASGVAPDPISVEVEIKRAGCAGNFEGGWMPWALQAMAEACAVEQLPHYMRIVSESSKARKLIALCTDCIAMAYGNSPWEDVLTQAREGISKLELGGSDSSTVHISVPIAEYQKELESLKDGKALPIVTSGIESADDVTGGHKGGQLIIVSARPGDGKSIEALGTCAANALIGVPALMFPLEMRNRELAERALISETRMNKNTLCGGMDFQQWKKFYVVAGNFEHSKLWLNDRVKSLRGIVGEIRRWHAKHVRNNKFPDGSPDPRGIVAIDYAQLIRLGEHHESLTREQQIAKISGTLKSLAMELDIPIILVAQLNRECVKRGGVPQISDLRESGALEQDADVIMIIHHEVERSWIIVGKNRGGATGKAGINWLRDLFRFESNGTSQRGEI